MHIAVIGVLPSLGVARNDSAQRDGLELTVRGRLTLAASVPTCHIEHPHRGIT